jgi:AraC family transcriptional regulator
MSLTTRALWVIERHLDRDLGLRDLAAACNVSPCHLSHAFTERVGRPITHYVRSRRLSCAAEALAAGAPDILDLALTSGYNSHEAFSRAFKALLGVTPERVRHLRTTAGLPLVPALDMTTIEECALPAPHIRTMSATTFVWLSERFSTDTMHGIPALWRRFMSSYAAIEGKVHPIPVGVTAPFDEDGSFAYGCAVQVDASATPPKGMTRLAFPARRYAVFRHAGHVSTIRGTYDAIWNRGLSDHGWTTPEEPCLEQHDPSFDPRTGEGGISIWIPVVDQRSDSRVVASSRWLK